MFKLIMIDYCMPNMDAPDSVLAILELLKKHGIKKRPQICCISAYQQKEFRAKAKEVGMDDFLQKPLEMHDMEN